MALPPTLSVVHNIFHILMLQKYVPNEYHMLDFTELGVAQDLTTVEWLIAILDQKERVLRNRTIPFMKVA